MNWIRNTTVISSFAAVIVLGGCSGSEESGEALDSVDANAAAEAADAAKTGDQAKLPPVSSADDSEAEGD